jgi:sialic acid synthase SpsE/quercetin dioxygenase-like cupin family protein
LRLSDATPLFVLEVANNHMGSLDHGRRIIDEFAEAVQGFPYHFAVKLQYRHLDTFIHPDYRGSAEYPYVKRFEETRLTPDQFKALRDAISVAGFLAMCTPFDERSVDLIETHDYDIVKIGSCSFTDWPLLERLVQVDKPIIASTAGATLDEIDRVASFFDHRGKDFALMHCRAEYPVAVNDLQLNQIDLLRSRYPGRLIGFSTHEDPQNLVAVRMAVAKGAAILEKHVGVPTDTIKLNAYSATPAQVRDWVAAADETLRACGVVDGRYPVSERERDSLVGLRRGVFAARSLAAGESLRTDDAFLAIPGRPGQLTANDMSKYTSFRLRAAVVERGPVMTDDLEVVDHREQVWDIITQVKDVLRTSGLAVPSMVDLEISHHYGLDRFAEYGVTMLNIVNREYAKKLLIILPGQANPEHYHERKEETFHVLYGEMDLTLDGTSSTLRAGDVQTVERGVKHAFGSTTGAVVEEISTTHYGPDSFYTDAEMPPTSDRKTYVTHWMG